MKIDDLKDLLDIMVVFSIPVSLFTKRDALTQDITVIYPNIIPMFYDYDVDILTQFLSHYQFTIINYNLILIKRLQLSNQNIKYFYPQLCISVTYLVAENILNQVNEDLYSNFVLIISKNA